MTLRRHDWQPTLTLDWSSSTHQSLPHRIFWLAIFVFGKWRRVVHLCWRPKTKWSVTKMWQTNPVAQSECDSLMSFWIFWATGIEINPTLDSQINICSKDEFIFFVEGDWNLLTARKAEYNKPLSCKWVCNTLDLCFILTHSNTVGITPALWLVRYNIWKHDMTRQEFCLCVSTLAGVMTMTDRFLITYQGVSGCWLGVRRLLLRDWMLFMMSPQPG